MKNRIIICDVAVDYDVYHDANISKSKYKNLVRLETMNHQVLPML